MGPISTHEFPAHSWNIDTGEKVEMPYTYSMMKQSQQVFAFVNNAGAIKIFLSILFFVPIFLPLSVGAESQVVYYLESNLRVGHSGENVVKLQEALEAGGFLTMPAGIARGYFGPITRAALIKYQIANQITPAVGFFGPITRAKLNKQVASLEIIPVHENLTN